MDIEEIDNQSAWDELVKCSGGHPLQLWGWGEVKHQHGWQVRRVRIGKGGAQLLIKQLPKPFGPLVYIPRGPFGEVLIKESRRRALEDYTRKAFAPLCLTVEPDTTEKLTWKGWNKSTNRILLSRTAVMDLTQTEEELLAQMSKKTRQYIRKSAGEGIVVRQAETVGDIDECLAIYKQTAKRAGFDLHDDMYYHDIFKSLGKDSPVFMAQKEGETVAFLWPIVTPEVAFELYGGMNDHGQELRANYYLKWRVIQAMKELGVKRYDVNGLLNDGVTAFKQGFIPAETQMSGTYDKPMSMLYPVYSTLLPTAKKLLRAVRR